MRPLSPRLPLASQSWCCRRRPGAPPECRGCGTVHHRTRRAITRGFCAQSVLLRWLAGIRVIQLRAHRVCRLSHPYLGCGASPLPRRGLCGASDQRRAGSRPASLSDRIRAGLAPRANRHDVSLCQFFRIKRHSGLAGAIRCTAGHVRLAGPLAGAARRRSQGMDVTTCTFYGARCHNHTIWRSARPGRRRQPCDARGGRGGRGLTARPPPGSRRRRAG